MSSALQRIREFISKQVIRETPWEFVTSAGAEVSIGSPIAHLGFNGTGGALWVRERPNGAPIALAYGGVGGSGSLSLVPSLGNVSFSIPQMPSYGTVYNLPFGGDSLTLGDMKGAFVLFTYAGDMGPGYGCSFMFLGCKPSVAAPLAALPGSLLVLQIPALCATAQGCVQFHGMSATLLPFNVGGSVYVGGIF